MTTATDATELLQLDCGTASVQPLDRVRVESRAAGVLVLRDGRGRVYLRHDLAGAGSVAVAVAGALGTHQAMLEDAEGRILATAAFRVQTVTAIEDAGGRMQRLLALLYDTMYQQWTSGYSKGLRIGEKFYKYYVSWLRDHVHSLKGMKYFDADIASGIELYTDHQREDGMVWDKVKEMAHSELQFWRDHEFAEGDFIRKIPGNPTRRFQRIPVENDVEFLLLEGIYSTWKALGDDEWMKTQLDAAIRAVRYSTSDPYRWSETYGLLKRGYTIDTWDFQHREDVARSGSSMRVHLDRTVFGVMHGDNTGMAVSCRYLAEMLRVAGREAEAGEFDQLADTLKRRLDELAWNGAFYRHHVSEDPSVTRDVGGTDEARQVTLSNAYALNRRIDHEQCVAIIRSYQKIREEMPKSSAGEFYNCYPPFEKGFGGELWNYMNGGCSTICAGELAHGAFEHGFETYGVDLLERILGWTERLGGYLHCTLKGALPEPRPQRFRPLDLDAVANVDFHGSGGEGAIGWTGEGDNDLRNLPLGRQRFHDIEFEIRDPAATRRRACLGLSGQGGYRREAGVGFNGTAGSLYFLHTVAGGGTGALVGWFRVRYADGSHLTQYVHIGQEVDSWFMPAPSDPFAGGNGKTRQGRLRTAWQGPNGVFENVGVQLYGWNNPHPEREIAGIEFVAAETGAKWFVLAVTASDTAVQLPVSPVSHGIPDMWGAAAMVYALIEGLAGVVDTDRAFERARVSPRWSAAGIDAACVSVVYPASGGYVRYRYGREADRLWIELAASGEQVDLEVLLPEGAQPSSLELDGAPVALEVREIERSRYVVLPLQGLGLRRIELGLR